MLNKLILLIFAAGVTTSAFARDHQPPPPPVSGDATAYTSIYGRAGGSASVNGSTGVSGSFQATSARASNNTTINAFRNPSNRGLSVGVKFKSSGTTESVSYGSVTGNASGYTSGTAYQRSGGWLRAGGNNMRMNHRGEGGNITLATGVDARQYSKMTTTNTDTGFALGISGGNTLADVTASGKITTLHNGAKLKLKSTLDVEAGGSANDFYGEPEAASGGGTVYGEGYGYSYGRTNANGLISTMDTMDDGTIVD